MAQGYLLSGKAVREQKRINKIVRGGFRRRRPTEKRPRYPGGGTPKPGAIAKIGPSGVPAATEDGGGLAPGVGGAVMYLPDESDPPVWQEAQAIEVRNSVPGETVDAGKWVQLKKIDGYWFVDVEPCDGS